MKPSLLISIVAAVFVLWPGGVCSGETIFVDAAGGGDFTSIQAAIDSAANGDEIVVAPGTYNEAINFNGKAVRLVSSGGAVVTIINASGLNVTVVRCVTGEGPDTILEGFTITGGNVLDASWPDSLGGGMANIDSSPTVIDCIFIANSAVRGGGMYNLRSSPTLGNCIFSGNLAEHYGGAMWNETDSSPTLIDCVFSDNTAYEYGGGIFNRHSSNPEITRCTFSGNDAFSGGGVANSFSSPTITDSVFTDNSAFWGGGVSNGYSSPTLINCIFSGNIALNPYGYTGDGGGVYNNRADPIFINCTFIGNVAEANGGGLYNSSSNATVTNCIIWDNGPTPIFDDSSTPVVTYSNVQGGYTGIGNIEAYPFFVDAAGGDLRLMQYSACIDAGHDAAVPAGITTDLAGKPRIADGSGDGTSRVDMGAYEFESDHVRVGLGTLSVVLTPDAAVSAGAMWRIEGAEDWLGSDEAVDLTPGYYTIEFVNLADWLEPHIVSIGYDENDPNRVSVRNPRVRVIGDMTAAVEAAYVPLPFYTIGQIPAAQAADNSVMEFIVEAPWSDSDVQFSVVPGSPGPSGQVSIDPVSGHFTYQPHADDRFAFELTFTAINGSDAVEQTIQVTPLLTLAPEYETISRPVQSMPGRDSRDYNFENTTLSDGPEYLNGSEWQNVRSVTVAGLEIIIENVFGNPVYGYHENRDIKDLTIYAETLIIRDSLRLPQTQVTIHARKLIFEDNGNGQITHISTVPIDWRPPEQRPDSLAGGNITLYIEAYQAAGGLCGRFAITGVPSDLEHGQAGVLTCTLDTPRPLGWFSPYMLKMEIARVRDAYLYGHIVQTRQILEEYDDLLAVYFAESEWQSLPVSWQFEFEQMHQEITMLIHRIDSGFDYFGNPHNWVPALSFEVLKSVYEQEIDHAIRALYVSYWLTHVANEVQDKAAGLETARERLWQETTQFKADYIILQSLLGPIRTQSAKISSRIGQADSGGCSGLLCWLRQKEAAMLHSARVNVANNDLANWDRTTWALTTLATHTAAGAEIGSIAGGKGAVAGAVVGYFVGAFKVDSYIPMEPDRWANASDVTDVAKTYNSLDFNEAADAWGEQFNHIDLSGLEDGNAEIYLQNLRADAHRLSGGLREIKESLWKTRLDDAEVFAELNRIKAGDPAFGRLVDEVIALTMEKQALNRQLAAVLQQISSLSNAMTHNVLAIDAMNHDIGEMNRIYDPRVAMYVREMQRRALARLEKYHYYMAKAYEYRLLKPYPGDLNIDAMFTLMVNMASLDGKLTQGDFNALKAVYQEQLSTIAETILDEFMDGHIEQNVTGLYTLSPEEIDRLNAGKPLTVNLFDKGLFPTGRENIRIVKIEVDHIECVSGDYGYNELITLTMHHPSISKLQWKDNVYVFRHLSPGTHKPLTHKWESDYYPSDGFLYHVGISASSSSLLWSLLGTQANQANAMIYSRPAAWADLVMTKTDTGGSPMDIQTMRLKLQYDFYSKETQFQTVRVTTEPKALSPHFILNAYDLSDRRDGAGNIYRVYNSWQEVEVTAPQTYGYWRFDRWTNQQGVTLPLPDQSARTVFLSQGHQTIRANYVYDGPLLSIADFDENYWVDYYDFEALARVWMTTPAHPDWDARFDLSDSDSVGLEDLLIFLDDWLAMD